MGKMFPAGVKKGSRHAGKNIWSRQMEYARMRNERVRIPGNPKEIIVPQYTPPTPEAFQKMLKKPVFSIEIETGGVEPIVLHRTSRNEVENLVHIIKKKTDRNRMIKIKRLGKEIYNWIFGEKITKAPETPKEDV